MVPLAVDVLLPIPAASFRFLAPFDKPAGPVGARVVVPWQGGARLGLVASSEQVKSSETLELREIIDWYDQEPYVAPGIVALIEHFSRYTATPPGVVLADLLPFGLKEAFRHQVKLLAPAGGELELPEDSWLEAERLPLERLDHYRRQGLVLERATRVLRTVRVLAPRLPPDDSLTGTAQANQRRALELLWQRKAVASAAQLAREAGVPDSAVRNLVRKGYAEYRELPAPPAPLPSFPASGLLPSAHDLPLPDQGSSSITGGRRRDRLAALLPTIKRDLAAGRQVLLLAPEHHILEETARQLTAEVPVLTLSGELGDDQRQRLWREISQGLPLVLIGTYPALCLPLRACGRLVVLEAGSSNYKLPAGARLHVPTLALWYAKQQSLPVTLCDVLPSPEMMITIPQAQRLRLGVVPQRLALAELTDSPNWPLSPQLIRLLRQVAQRHRQAVLLSPRRGFSAALGCRSCGWLAMCPHCDLPLRYHHRDRKLRCHQCGYLSSPPPRCPDCREPELRPLRGAGTEWIAAEVNRQLPDLPVVCLDRDHRGDLRPLLAGEPGVVVATSRIFREPLLPEVSLIAVTLLDTYLNQADFRAEEEVMRLLLNLVELSKQRRPLVLVQTFSSHPLLRTLQQPDLEAAIDDFLRRLLERRRHFDYPPFSRLARIQVTARRRSDALRVVEGIAERLRNAGADDRQLLGPAPAPLARVRGEYAFQLFVRARDYRLFQQLLEAIGRHHPGARVRLDVDPRDVGAYLS